MAVIATKRSMHEPDASYLIDADQHNDATAVCLF